jgi:hypothetical protein
MRALLKKYRNMEISHMYIYRRPISKYFSAILKSLNWIRGYHHDTLFHLFIVFAMEDGSMIFLEKNESLRMGHFTPREVDEHISVRVPVGAHIGAMLANMISVYGKDIVFRYDPTTTNCQQFVIDFLTGNNIHISKGAHTFILQDVSQLLPHWAKRIANVLVSIYSRINLVLQGYGNVAMDKHFCHVCARQYKNIASHVQGNKHILKLLGLG